MFVLLAVFAFGLLCLLDYYKRQYWIRKGVIQSQSIPFFGHFLPVVTQEKTSFGVFDTLVNQLDKPYFGVYEFWRPTLVVTDQKLIEHIVIKDFSNFLDHPRWIFDIQSFMHDSLFNMKGDKWRALRYQTIPWFTTSRMKSLFPEVLNCVNVPEGEFEGKEFIRYLSADTITKFFGAQISEKEEFFEMNHKIHEVSNFRYYKLLLVEHFSKFTDLLGITFTENNVNTFFKTCMKGILANKEHSLVKLFNKILQGKTIQMRKKDLYTKYSGNDEILSYEVTEDTIGSIAGMFLFAGLDTTGNAMTWLLYDLAMNPEVQVKAREEIRNTIQKHGDWTYEAVQDMKYVSKCINETLRLHPALPYMFRTCTTKYTTPDGLTIDKGCKIVIPTLSIHMDPKLYPEPELYKPERFGDVEKNTDLTWLTFGEGPRKCPGMRFSKMVMRSVLSRILENHELVFTEKTLHPIVPDHRTFFNRVSNNLYMKFNKVS